MKRLAVLCLVVLGCDPQARPAAAAAAANPSRERESCAASSDCEQPLRCIESVCRKPTVSRVGEYHWAAGRAALDKGSVGPATVELQRALQQFETDKIEAPAALLCDYGTALRRNTGDPKAAEQAARLLHRCLLAAPSGTPEHAAALRELVELEPAGLDPALLARDTPADTYLVRAPQRPAADTLKVEVAQTDAAHDKGYAAWSDVVKGEPARQAMIKCYGAYLDATQKAKLTVTIPLKMRAQIGDDDLYVGGTLEQQPDPGASGAEATAGQCVRDALAPMATDFAKKTPQGDWQGSLTLTLSAGS